MQAVGVDLSKNHYGIWHMDENDYHTFQYVYFKPYLKRDKAKTSYLCYIEREEKTKAFSYKQLCIKYDDKTNNMVEVDAMKSKLFMLELMKFVDDIKGDKFITLEDYVYSGGKVVQLVHVTESFKYELAQRNKGGLILFICPNSTWKKHLCPGLKLKSKDPKKPYSNIDACLASSHPKVKEILDSLNLKYDIYKDLVDSYSLAYMKKCYSSLFMTQYKKRIYVF